jgi:ABC-type nitrate/sulfonate/bicarbonate transport system substrate-binding protein
MTAVLSTFRHRLVAGLAAVLAIGALSACGSTAAGENSPGETTTIRYQSYAGAVDALQLADALGYLPGLTLKKVGDVTGGPQSVQALTSHQIDISSSCFFGSIAQVVATGAPIKAVVATYGSNTKISSGIVTLEGSPIKTAQDLIGKKVAVNTLGANAEAVLDTYLTKGGLSQEEIKKVTLVPLPGINEEAALREGKVEAAYLGGALQESALSRPGLKVLTTDVALVGPYNGGSIVLRDDFIKKNPELTRTFVAGLAKALVYTETHTADEVRSVLQDWLTKQGRPDDAKALTLWKGTGIATHAGLIRDRDFDLWLNWLKARGDVKTDSLKASDIYTNEFNPYAKEG